MENDKKVIVPQSSLQQGNESSVMNNNGHDHEGRSSRKEQRRNSTRRTPQRDQQRRKQGAFGKNGTTKGQHLWFLLEEWDFEGKDFNQLMSYASDLDNELVELFRKKSPMDKHAQALRNRIVQVHEKMLFQDLTASAEKDVMHRMWKSAFYRPIEEFRKMIKKYQTAATDALAVPMTRIHVMQRSSEEHLQEEKQPPAVTNNGSSTSGNNKLTKCIAALNIFLNNAKKYFQELFSKCISYINTTSIQSPLSAQANELMDRRVLHKIYLFLGDLERYSQLYTESEKNWDQARLYYTRALELDPFNGNAHNQLAVLATYNSTTSEDPMHISHSLNEIEAIYHYFRSLAVPEKPFASARENLIILFEKNRMRFLQLQQLRQQQQQQQQQAILEMKKRKKKTRRGGAKKSNKKTEREEQVPNEQDAMQIDNSTMLTQFVRMHGILFTRTSLETLDDIKWQVFRELKLLKEQENVQERLPEELVIKLVVMNIFCIERSLDNESFLEAAVALGCWFLRYLSENSAESNSYLASVSIMLKYVRLKLTHQKDIVKYFQNQAVWRSIASLVNHIKDISTTNQMVNLPEDVKLMGFNPLREHHTHSAKDVDLIPFDNEQDAVTNTRMNRIKKEVDMILDTTDSCVLKMDDMGNYRAEKESGRSSNEKHKRSTGRAKERKSKKKTNIPVHVPSFSQMMTEDDLLDDIRSDVSEDKVFGSDESSVEISASPPNTSTLHQSRSETIHTSQEIAQMHDMGPLRSTGSSDNGKVDTGVNTKFIQQLLSPAHFGNVDSLTEAKPSPERSGQMAPTPQQRTPTGYSLFSSSVPNTDTGRQGSLSSNGKPQTSFFSTNASASSMQNAGVWDDNLPNDSRELERMLGIEQPQDQWPLQHSTNRSLMPNYASPQQQPQQQGQSQPQPQQQNQLWGFVSGPGSANQWNDNSAWSSSLHHPLLPYLPEQSTSHYFQPPFHPYPPSGFFQPQQQPQQQHQQQEGPMPTFKNHQYHFGNGNT